MPSQPYRGLPHQLFHNNGDGTFREIGLEAGVALREDGAAIAGMGADFRDFDNDGRVDVVVTTLNGPAKLFRNTTEGGGHWLAFKLRGTRSNRQGLGAVVRMTLPDGRVLVNHATTSVGYACSSEPLVRFGLGSHAEAKKVEIRWPGGRRQELENVKGDRMVEAEEPPR